ncbi:MAG: hypothetical protein ACT4OP_13675 [Actinomycetota bacterium]
MGWLRVVILLLVLAGLAIAALPVLVLLDLLGGGTGWGLCPAGLSGCPDRYTTGPVLAAYLMLALMVVVALIRVVSRLLRRLDRNKALVGGPVNGPS